LLACSSNAEQTQKVNNTSNSVQATDSQSDTVEPSIDTQQKSEPVATEAVVWIDTRSWIENKIDSIEGDPRVSYADIVAGVAQLGLQKNTPIRLYCAAGVRAGKAVKMLHTAGYSDVENAGGIDDVRTIRFPSNSPATN